ncbi:hypothetical protein EES43_28165 [Streptomyces sp. ADI96-02]|uniref:hypothetical protein n=1 Tax=unclassified Streptomyces TaxID=2593676 RepID=UPI000FBC940D|nr:hypothetical protein [Streptomyces sp. ADI96-02]RPK54727.1 hypothetical protein EES43_28165 [Streptomyces sp. ADI96-02]
MAEPAAVPDRGRRPPTDSGRWEVARLDAEVHALLCASDALHARLSGTPVPRRDPETTRRRVRAGCVRVLRSGGTAVASFTLTTEPPFPPDEARFAPAARPLYLSRLSVLPALLETGEPAGLRCLREALREARARGADVLRAQANPDLRGSSALLAQLGFEQQGPVLEDAGVRRVHLQRRLTAT